MMKRTWRQQGIGISFGLLLGSAWSAIAATDDAPVSIEAILLPQIEQELRSGTILPHSLPDKREAGTQGTSVAPAAPHAPLADPRLQRAREPREDGVAAEPSSLPSSSETAGQEGVVEDAPLPATLPTAEEEERSVVLPAALPEPPPSSKEMEVMAPVSEEGKRMAFPWQNSLMFSQEERALLEEALKRWDALSSRSMAATAGSFFQPEAAEAGGLSTQHGFFLNSLLYLSPGNWSVWLNDSKYASGEAGEDISITVSNGEKAHFLWYTNELDTLSPRWRDRLPVRTEGGFASADGNITINREGTEVRFTLRPNQTFVISSMSIKEGRAHDGQDPLLSTHQPPPEEEE